MEQSLLSLRPTLVGIPINNLDWLRNRIWRAFEKASDYGYSPHAFSAAWEPSLEFEEILIDKLCDIPEIKKWLESGV